jgi:hypothetical protein
MSADIAVLGVAGVGAGPSVKRPVNGRCGVSSAIAQQRNETFQSRTNVARQSSATPVFLSDR